MPETSLSDVVSSLRRGVLMTSRRLRAQRAADLTESQYSVLAHLLCDGETSPSELAHRECVSAPSMTRIVTGLAEAGFVERRAHPTDGRQVLVAISEAGREAIEATRRRRDAWLTARLASLEADDVAALERAAEILRRIAAQ